MYAHSTPNCSKEHVRFAAVNGHILSVSRNEIKFFQVFQPTTSCDHRAVLDAIDNLADEPPCPACQEEQKSLLAAHRGLR